MTYATDGYPQRLQQDGWRIDYLLWQDQVGDQPALPARIDAERGDAKVRLIIDRWFYSCSHEMHTRLADMYEADPRFAANIDKAAAGLTPYLSAAIRANAARPRQ